MDFLDTEWYHTEYIKKIQRRLYQIIDLRGFAPAGSVASAAVDHMRDWTFGSDQWHSVAFKTDGKLYGVPEGLVFSFPCTSRDGTFFPV